MTPAIRTVRSHELSLGIDDRNLSGKEFSGIGQNRFPVFGKGMIGIYDPLQRIIMNSEKHGGISVSLGNAGFGIHKDNTDIRGIEELFNHPFFLSGTGIMPSGRIIGCVG